MDDEPVRKDTGCPYKMVVMNDKLRYVHRIVAQTWVNNQRPDIFDKVDHIDKNPTSNHCSNLRWVNSSINALNSDALNVTFIKKVPMGKRWRTVNRWRAQVKIHGKTYHLGYHKTFLEGFRTARKFREENIKRIYKELCDEAQPTRPYLFLKWRENLATKRWLTLPHFGNCWSREVRHPMFSVHDFFPSF